MAADIATGSVDVAIAEVDNKNKQCTNYVYTTRGKVRVLQNRSSQGPYHGLTVQKFCNGGDGVTGIVVDGDFTSFRSGLFRCFTVQNDGQPIHVDGESGVLVTSKPCEQLGEENDESAETVNAVGMLVGIETSATAEGELITVSVGVPYDRNMDALRAICGRELSELL